MSYSIEIIRKSEQKTSSWSGGTTTQLAIYPKDASYNNRNFKWRISSAKVETTESIFTPLPSFWRLIMIIDGQMHLEHKDHHSISLNPFEQDSFSGEWTTHSYGKVTDFNLMMAKGCKGNLEAIEILEEENIEIVDIHDLYTNEFTISTEGFYCINHHVSIVIDQKEEILLQKGNLLLIHMKSPSQKLPLKILNEIQKTIHIIRVSVVY
ncbi:HutD/Ves family protein [Crassaminicella profunda]|uniref:HutD/Ves family protein n=1 Tax=Crassaminicella profunda TaxID=1286698 RepID=UPI001CA70D20|nr:HutD family protein [Crassaminicella profunda]QZY54937.1 HutD family protein [Crassaminicella profunda]